MNNISKIEYTYADGAAVILEFYEELLKFEWVAGPRAGVKAEGFTYKFQEIANQIYLVTFQMKEAKNFVNLIFNFENNTMYGSAIMGYATDQEFVIFEDGVITNVEK